MDRDVMFGLDSLGPVAGRLVNPDGVSVCKIMLEVINPDHQRSVPEKDIFDNGRCSKLAE